MYHPLAFVLAFAHIAAAIALLNGILTTIGQGNVAAKAIESIARQPEARGPITTNMFIGLAMAETSGIYGFVIAILILFVRPLIGPYLEYLTNPRFPVVQTVCELVTCLPL
ncbi:MAG: ATP synthase F0 subunit C [Defluviitaleaceae bacterium]|nr:ATP synthase F0 subunit C [Defluviitaleaceae bacterium]MCL2275447.1 ATP synthase F0 subunit C [Defluviitaleaceae bacterium]